MTLQVKPPPETLASHNVPVSVPAALLPVLLSANGVGNAGAPRMWAPDIVGKN